MFKERMQSCCEFELYTYMTQNLAIDWATAKEWLLGKQYMRFNAIMLTIEDVMRCSGEMNTSLGNGFSNLMFWCFVLYELGEEFDGVIEGDDGLTSSYLIVPDDHFEKLGLSIKLQRHDSLNTASFCGLIFDVHDKSIITDPIETLLNIGWGDRRYMQARKSKHMELLRSKGLSYLHQYAGCPIIQELALYLIRETRGIQLSNRIIESMARNSYELVQLREMLEAPGVARPVGPGTRKLMEQVYGVSVELQLHVEEYLKNKRGLGPLDLPILHEFIHPHAIDYYNKYVCISNVRSPLNLPYLSVTNSQTRIDQLVAEVPKVTFRKA